jgi:hypothetical protein
MRSVHQLLLISLSAGFVAISSASATSLSSGTGQGIRPPGVVQLVQCRNWYQECSRYWGYRRNVHPGDCRFD